MTDSLRLLLEDFLGLMREEGELDTFLPLLMSSMGHEVVYRPQKGPRQYGADIVSVGKDTDGNKKLFIWLVKCGDIGRTDWNSGPQSIRQSMDDIRDVYLASHVAPEHKALRKKVLIVTNGDFKSNLNETIALFLTKWSREAKVQTEQVNGSKLAAWTEEWLLDEYILPTSNRALLRRMLANANTPDLCVQVGEALVDSMLDGALAPASSDGARTKRLLTGLRGIRTALNVLHVWATNENNLLGPYILSRYAVLATWARLHERLKVADTDACREFGGLLFQLAFIAQSYHERLDAYYHVQDAFAHSLPDSLLVSRTVFDELGRLGQQGCFWAFHGAVAERSDFSVYAFKYAARVRALLQTHKCSALPAFDYHAANIHTALLLLVATGHHDEAQDWVKNLCQRMHYATALRKYLPMSASFDDAILVRHGYEEVSNDFQPTSTLLPVLFTWTAVLGMNDGYEFLRAEVLPKMKSTTPNFWSSEQGYDDTVSAARSLHEHGIGETIMDIPDDPREFLRQMSVGLVGVEHIERSSWYQARAPYIPILAAMHWQAQIPREAIVRQAMAFAGVELAPPTA